jgi:hypothetical protein
MTTQSSYSEPTSSAVRIEQRAGRWLVILESTTGRAVVGRHTAKYRAVEQRDRLIAEGQS